MPGIRLPSTFVARCLTVATLLVVRPAAADPKQADIEKATKHMKAGVEFFMDPNGAKYEEAYREFKKAHELSGSLNALLNLAICAQNLELDGEAIEHYETYLRKKGKDVDPADKEQIDMDLKRLKASVAWVTIKVNQPGVTITDIRTPRRGKPIRNIYTIKKKGSRKIGIHPGEHLFTATRKGSSEKKWKTSLKYGAKLEHAFRF